MHLLTALPVLVTVGSEIRRLFNVCVLKSQTIFLPYMQHAAQNGSSLHLIVGSYRSEYSSVVGCDACFLVSGSPFVERNVMSSSSGSHGRRIIRGIHSVETSGYTGRFIMFSVITNIYNKKTKGPTLMELFTATGELKKFFLFDN